MYLCTLSISEFREYMLGESTGPWGDTAFEKTFGPHLDEAEGTIEIEYKYGDYKNGKSTIKFRVPDTNKFWVVRYTGSSPFAMWWCQLTDGIEEDADDNE